MEWGLRVKRRAPSRGRTQCCQIFFVFVLVVVLFLVCWLVFVCLCCIFLFLFESVAHTLNVCILWSCSSGWMRPLARNALVGAVACMCAVLFLRWVATLVRVRFTDVRASNFLNFFHVLCEVCWLYPMGSSKLA